MTSHFIVFSKGLNCLVVLILTRNQSFKTLNRVTYLCQEWNSELIYCLWSFFWAFKLFNSRRSWRKSNQNCVENESSKFSFYVITKMFSSFQSLLLNQNYVFEFSSLNNNALATLLLKRAKIFHLKFCIFASN